MKKLIRISVAVLLFTGYIASAQKLPRVQQQAFKAPANVKIDGKLNEWGGKLQAYNTATEIFYTVANDDQNIYLVIQARYHDVVDKILRGGLTFTINHTVKKNDASQVTVTYPVLREGVMAEVSNAFARKANEKREANNASIPVDDMNTLLDARSKLISVTGIKGIANDLSVYNEEGINAVSRFDTDVNYTYELAIPLKYLDLPDGGKSAFAYHISVNVAPEGHVSSGGPPPPPVMMTQLSITDFWGEYTLIKK